MSEAAGTRRVAGCFPRKANQEIQVPHEMDFPVSAEGPCVQVLNRGYSNKNRGKQLRSIGSDIRKLRARLSVNLLDVPDMPNTKAEANTADRHRDNQCNGDGGPVKTIPSQRNQKCRRNKESQ